MTTVIDVTTYPLDSGESTGTGLSRIFQHWSHTVQQMIDWVLLRTLGSAILDNTGLRMLRYGNQRDELKTPANHIQETPIGKNKQTKLHTIDGTTTTTFTTAPNTQHVVTYYLESTSTQLIRTSSGGAAERYRHDSASHPWTPFAPIRLAHWAEKIGGERQPMGVPTVPTYLGNLSGRN